MADKIQLRAGNKAGMPTLTDREPAYVRDEKALYIGTPDGNVDITGELKQAVRELWEVMDDKLAADSVASQPELASDADLATVVAALNALIAAMKKSGVMIT